MKHNKFIILLLYCALVASQQAEAKTFEDYLAVLKTHPDTASILEGARASYENADVASGLPKPVLFAGVDNVPTGNPSFNQYLPSSKVVGFSQKIPNPWVRNANKKTELQLSVIQKINADFEASSLRALFSSSLISKDSLKKQLEIAKKQITLYEALEGTYVGEVNSGKNAFFRLSEVDVEKSEVISKINNIQALLAESDARLIRLVGEIPNIGAPILEKREYWDVEQTFPVKIAQNYIDLAQHGLSSARSSLLPDFGVTASYKFRESSSTGAFDGGDWFSAQLQISVPLWAGQTELPKIRSARHKANEARFSYESTKRLWEQKIKSLKAFLDAANSNAKSIQDQYEATFEKVEAIKRGYESGNFDLSILLMAQIDLLNVQAQLIKEKERERLLLADINSYFLTNFQGE